MMKLKPRPGMPKIMLDKNGTLSANGDWRYVLGEDGWIHSLPIGREEHHETGLVDGIAGTCKCHPSTSVYGMAHDRRFGVDIDPEPLLHDANKEPPPLPTT